MKGVRDFLYEKYGVPTKRVDMEDGGFYWQGGMETHMQFALRSNQPGQNKRVAETKKRAEERRLRQGMGVAGIGDTREEL